MTRVPKATDPISRVKCMVDSCEYWDSGNHCKAQTIEIEPPGAPNSETTDCATFTPRRG